MGRELVQLVPVKTPQLWRQAQRASDHDMPERSEERTEPTPVYAELGVGKTGRGTGRAGASGVGSPPYPDSPGFEGSRTITQGADCRPLTQHQSVSGRGLLRTDLHRPHSCPVPLCLVCLFVCLWMNLRHMEGPRLRVESELQLPAYTITIATPDPSHICGLL